MEACHHQQYNRALPWTCFSHCLFIYGNGTGVFVGYCCFSRCWLLLLQQVLVIVALAGVGYCCFSRCWLLLLQQATQMWVESDLHCLFAINRRRTRGNSGIYPVFDQCLLEVSEKYVYVHPPWRLWNLAFVFGMVLDTLRAFRRNSVDETLSSCCLWSLTHGISSFSITGQIADFPLLAILDFGIFWIRSFCFLQDLTFDSSIVNSRPAERLPLMRIIYPN